MNLPTTKKSVNNYTAAIAVILVLRLVLVSFCYDRSRVRLQFFITIRKYLFDDM